MGQKPSWINEIPDQVISYYQSGHSLKETSQYFNNCGDLAVYRLLKKHGIPRRTRTEGNSIKWTDEFRQRQVNARTGKPSGAKGKRWKYDRVIERPNSRGAKNPQWKGGRVDLIRAIRNSAMYKLWRRQVFERDWYTCISCGAKRKADDRVIIQADHIVPLAAIVERHSIKTVDDARVCLELWDINNGRTLCKKCHKQTETYGVNFHHRTKKARIGNQSVEAAVSLDRAE